jgi:cytochrome c oxidase subunit 4
VATAEPSAEASSPMGHVVSARLLLGVFAALVVLTVLTVTVTSLDLGSTGNLVVAMAVATLKAALVVAFFMHLLWDKKFNLLVFLSSLLFLVLFLGVTMMDRAEYQPFIDQLEAATAAKAAATP